MAPLVNFEDAPECGMGNRKQFRSRFASLKAHEAENTYEEEYDEGSLDPSSGAEEMTYEEGMSKDKEEVVSYLGAGMQAPDMTSSGESHDCKFPQLTKDMTSSVDLAWGVSYHFVQGLSPESSEATDTWDLCETSSVSSSWLDLEDQRASLQVIEDEDVVVVKQGKSEASTEAAKTPSFAEILGRSSGLFAAPRPVKPNWGTSQVLKPVPEHHAAEERQEVEDWEMYKFRSAQVRSRQWRKRKCKR